MSADPTLELLWGLRAASTRGPKAAIGVPEIAAAAVAIADDEGYDAVSMERVAAALGYTKMSLYRHVSSKAELLAVMIELAIGEPPSLAGVRGGWRARARRWAHLMWDCWDEHPWVPEVTVGNRAVGPHEVGWSVAGLEAFEGSGLSRAETVDAVALLSAHLHSSHATSTAGSQPWTPDLHADPMLGDVMRRSGRAYPALDAVVTGRAVSPDRRTFGLERILDGIEAHLAKKA
ncbi:TetR/AcrR family transcriptional regulator [Luteipulveratus halotolerans]|uniref:HTH tetR-type domain-containing protein n=1 Tax=Luteipulveratus halotolerans TaxID=1631356 RepID=A0A0L6CKI1_9MICO|nr:helix-turn-helix domain-containing protein [Luteipulveratus halotolerans]KNX38306.1 hypothetical protein VV01_16025 [Luteipulveratus halotolerans]